MSNNTLHVFGIRHHGPGCARSLRAALEKLSPDIVLVEGPPDAHEVLPLLTHQDMQPPVALLIYAPDKPKQAVYYPFTVFSPEWQALQYALIKQIPARFIDLPQAIQFARAEESDKKDKPSAEVEPLDEQKQPENETSAFEIDRKVNNADLLEPTDTTTVQDDPLMLLAQAAGYTDHELWWERQIEQRQNVADLFESILEAMTELRGETTPKDEREALREAYMRQSIREAQKEGYQRIAIVCGAWHAPVLINPGPAKADADLLKGLPRVKVQSTWIPWTNSRLSYHSGYGAGVNSPGWYEHLWTTPEKIGMHWLIKAAHLLRAEGMDASSASVIEAVRLSDTLAALRDLAAPGQEELTEAIKTVLCHGKTEPMELIRTKLEMGEKLGKVPTDAPTVPLQRDLDLKIRTLRLKQSADQVKLELDLRKDQDRQRSQLFHQLNLLDVPWGQEQRVYGKLGTFHENWMIAWRPEFAVALIEANIWGTTVETATTGLIRHKADEAQELPDLTDLLNKTILAELSDAIEYVLQVLSIKAAVSADVEHLMNALPPLAQIIRYGNVRQTKVERILPVFDGFVERIIIGLVGACSTLDDDAARSMVESIDKANDSINLLNHEEQKKLWQETLSRLQQRENVHGYVRGRCCRILLEQQFIDEVELQRITGLALSTAESADQAAAWIEGVLRGNGLVMLHQDNLWRALDYWLVDLPTDIFEALLPVLRRAFAGFQDAERRKMGEKVKHLHTHQARTTGGSKVELDEHLLNTDRAQRVLPVLAQLIGATFDAK